MESYQATDVAKYSICGKGSQRLMEEMYGKTVLAVDVHDLAAIHGLARSVKGGEAGEDALLLMPYGERAEQRFRDETVNVAQAAEPAKKLVDHDVTTVAMGGKAVIQVDDLQAQQMQKRSVRSKKPKGRSR